MHTYIHVYASAENFRKDVMNFNIGRHHTMNLDTSGNCTGRSSEHETKSMIECMGHLNASIENAWVQMRGTQGDPTPTAHRQPADPSFMPEQAWGQWLWQENLWKRPT